MSSYPTGVFILFKIKTDPRDGKEWLFSLDYIFDDLHHQSLAEG